MAKQKVTIYQLGKKPQYGRARWERYEDLRVKGLTKNEARGFSRITSPQGLSVIESIIKGRQRLMGQFATEAERKGWAGNKLRYEYYKILRQSYERRGLTSKNGKRTKVSEGGHPDIFSLYHEAENRLAKQSGWKIGQETGPSRRSKGETPRRKDTKGNVGKQRRRAKDRAKALGTRHQGNKVPLERLQSWLKESELAYRRSIGTMTMSQRQNAIEFRRGLRGRIREAEVEEKAGRKAVA